MRRSSFLLLAAVTAAAVVGAAIAWQHQERDVVTSQTVETKPLYPDLLGRIDDVTRLKVVAGADGTTTMERKGGTWGVVERAGYPADFEKVRKAMLGVAGLEKLEPKTSKPELYAKLDLQDADKPDAKSVRVTMAAGDKVLADLLIGKTQANAAEGGGTYVRKVGDAQSWLARGEVRLERKLAYWLDRNIMNVDQRRVRRVVVTHPDGSEVAVAKDDVGGDQYALTTPVPEGREAKQPYDIRAVADTLDFLILEDVRKASEVPMPPDALKTVIDTYDGLRVTIHGADKDGHTWFTIEVAKGERDPKLDAFVKANKGKDSDAGRIADQMKTAEEVDKEVARLSKKVQGWAYRFTDFKTGKVKSTVTDLTDEKKKPEAKAGDAAGKPAEAGSGEAPAPAAPAPATPAPATPAPAAPATPAQPAPAAPGK